MAAIDDLRNLPLSHLFAAPLIAATDASVQAQSEQLDVLFDTGFDDDGELVMVAFNYTTAEVDPETGTERRVSKQLTLPLLLFLSVPELVINRIEEQFSARITEVQNAEGDRPTRGLSKSFATPLRLNVAPASKSTSFTRRTEETFDLDITMVAELENQSTGLEMLQRAANNAVAERYDESRTERLENRNAAETTISPGRDEPR